MNIIVWDSGVEQPKDKGILLKDIIENATTEKDKSYCIDANYFKGSSVENYQDKSRRQLVITGGAFRGRNPENTSDRTPGAPTEQRLEINHTGKSNALTSVSKDSLVISNYNCDNPVNIETEKMKCLRTQAGGVTKGIGITEDNLTWRKLTPIECERLQTVTDRYSEGVSNSQRYKMLGNGFTISVISHILENIK